MTKGINNAESDSVETLDLEPQFCHDSKAKEYLRIAVLPEDTTGPDGTLSLQIIQFDREWKVDCLQVCLNLSEIDITIAALQEAKKRMEALNGQGA